jgi:hypothetical protein
MILSTLLNLVVVPVLYIAVEGLRRRLHRSPAAHRRVEEHEPSTLRPATLGVDPDGTLVAVTSSNGKRNALRVATLGGDSQDE